MTSISSKKIASKIEHSIDKTKMKIKEKLNLFDPVIIYPFRGYGNDKKAYVNGRILEKEQVIHDEKNEEYTLWNNIHKVWKRYESDEVPGVSLEGTLEGIKASTKSNEEGYFELEFDLTDIELSNGWHPVSLTITDMPFDIEFEADSSTSVLINNQDSNFGIISDVDDTIIKSNAMNTFKKLKIMLTKDAESRVAFDGVPELYNALINDYNNPLFFVSGSSYNLHDLLISFCKDNNIPEAPFLLRNLGLSPDQWIKQETHKYKIKHIDKLMELYDRLSFIVIGDSGQHDPEIYVDLISKYPNRIKAIYIRHVASDERKQELQKMAANCEVPFLIMKDSDDALEHASSQGWI